MHISKANGRLLVPATHGIDRLAQLGAARLVDAAGINPDVFEPLSSCGLGCSFHFCKAGQLGSLVKIFDVLEEDLLLLPRVRQYRIARSLVTNELREFEGGCVQQPHGDRLPPVLVPIRASVENLLNVKPMALGQISKTQSLEMTYEQQVETCENMVQQTID